MAVETQITESLPANLTVSLLDLFEVPSLVANLSGALLLVNDRARQALDLPESVGWRRLNLFGDILRMDPQVLLGQIESGESEVDLQLETASGRLRARLERLSNSEWLVLRLEPARNAQSPTQSPTVDKTIELTVQSLLQEREITYRNLLAAYLRLQEVNRQKTVFLASAAHELKTPLAVIKGYYDLLLSGSLGKLTDKQRDILQESKDSCERLVRLVSMFLHYSALESGKLVLHLRENMGEQRTATGLHLYVPATDGQSVGNFETPKVGAQMAEKERILVVDDEPSIRKYLGTLLEVDGYQVETVVSGREAVEKIEAGDRPDFVILDVLMPELSGLETLKMLMQIDRSLNVVMLSCSNEVGTVVEAIRLGAQDYLTKPFEKAELDVAMLKCRQKQQLRAENKSLREYCDAITEDICFLAASPQMVRIRQQILQIAPVDVPVFIYGESGVGKEVVARMIHMRSTRRSQAFIKVNCAALPGELLESE